MSGFNYYDFLGRSTLFVGINEAIFEIISKEKEITINDRASSQCRSA